ncbi:MTOR-associated protein MEAK7 [Sesamum alatum]|uniref:MTOR-associated protein MEAK7 n=1 Tax=Sesamum alatum TaxID=300844 RepID=A0AAE1YLU6_9LAMI|nr:MTOR-associated protein MEAK7 [Sesamum alatum]
MGWVTVELNCRIDGPTVLIIKDKEGCIYGGYASQPWEKHSDFYGDMRSFLFQLYPVASIFRPTGANHNLQWCAVNFSSESIPNGIGFGGRVHHFGLFLSANFDQGHTFSCTTFGSPCLSKTSQIYPEVIECWGVVPRRADQDRPEVIKGTVLERFKEDRHMLNMVGLANSSE